MAKRRRLSYPNIPQHLIRRGSNRHLCFADEQDMLTFGQWLCDYSTEYGVAIHSWVFMTNHIHPLATPTGENSIGLMMQALGRRYVRYFNNRHRRTGTLWKGRYKSCLVDADSYLLHCQRYIELNPVRAAMLTAPGDYRWASYRTNAFGKASRPVSPHRLYRQLGTTQAECQSAYRELFKEVIDDNLVKAIRTTTLSGLALGNEKFKREIEALTGQSASAGKPG